MNMLDTNQLSFEEGHAAGYSVFENFRQKVFMSLGKNAVAGNSAEEIIINSVKSIVEKYENILKALYNARTNKELPDWSVAEPVKNATWRNMDNSIVDNLYIADGVICFRNKTLRNRDMEIAGLKEKLERKIAQETSNMKGAMTRLQNASNQFDERISAMNEKLNTSILEAEKLKRKNAALSSKIKGLRKDEPPLTSYEHQELLTRLVSISRAYYGSETLTTRLAHEIAMAGLR
jgi:hypothetical protein